MSSNDEGDGQAITVDVLTEKLRDASIPGFMAECDPDEAEAMGAFTEEALSLKEALEGMIERPEQEIENNG